MRLKELRIKNNLNQESVAKFLGVTQATLSGWENGKYEPDIESLKKLASLYCVTIDYMLGRTQTDSSYKNEAIMIPVLGRVAAGIPIDAIEEIIDYEEISPEKAKSGTLIGLKIKGQSMEPRICDGDVVIVKCQNYIENNHIGIVLINGDEATCKKIKFTEKGILLLSLNPLYEPMFFTTEEIKNLPVKIFGEVIELRGKF